MAIVGDGRSNIYNFDSLLPYNMLDSNFQARIAPGKVDIITTNPPFGTKIDDTRDFVLEQYDFALLTHRGYKFVQGGEYQRIIQNQATSGNK